MKTSFTAIFATAFTMVSAITISLPSGVSIPSGVNLPSGVVVQSAAATTSTTTVAVAAGRRQVETSPANANKKRQAFGQATSSTQAAAKARRTDGTS